MRAGRRLWPLLRWPLTLFLVAASLVFLAHRVRTDWQALEQVEITLVPLPFALHLVLTATSFLLLTLGWHALLRLLGARLPLAASAHSWFLGGLARYVPGKVASLLGRLVICRRHGVPPTTAGLGLVMEQALYAVLALAFLLVAALVQAPVVPTSPPALALLVAVAAAIALLLHPRIFHPLSAWGLRLTGTAPDGAARPRPGALLAVAALLLAGWLVYGIGGYFLVRSLTALEAVHLPTVTLAFLGAWAAGFLAFLVPAGLGVREATLALLLSPLLRGPADVAVAVLARLTWVGVELAGAGLASLAVRGRSPEAAPVGRADR